MDVKGKTVLLSGAGGGIGRALARELKHEGAELILTGRSTEALAELSAELDATMIAADLSRPDEVQRLVARSGSVDVLIANAAVHAGGRLGDVAVRDIDEAIAVNLRAPIVMAHGIVPLMVAQRHGHIVFIGSAGSRVTAANSPVYNATKFGLRGFALALRQDLHRLGIGVSIVEPVFVREAGMFVDSGVAVPRGMRTNSPHEVARAVVRTIKRNKAETIVAPADMRLALALGAMVPELSARAGRLFGVNLESPSR
ncbi:MAG: SDR family NAD(P)-dependent oxidoreductase [Mycolicibacterium cosmeticum]|nr:SDR family NAD(P)-dependent oxidoreductase [Mycolicibacterium cosmeticum]